MARVLTDFLSAMLQRQRPVCRAAAIAMRKLCTDAPVCMLPHFGTLLQLLDRAPMLSLGELDVRDLLKALGRMANRMPLSHQVTAAIEAIVVPMIDRILRILGTGGNP